MTKTNTVSKATKHHCMHTVQTSA